MLLVIEEATKIADYLEAHKQLEIVLPNSIYKYSYPNKVFSLQDVDRLEGSFSVRNFTRTGFIDALLKLPQSYFSHLLNTFK